MNLGNNKVLKILKEIFLTITRFFAEPFKILKSKDLNFCYREAISWIKNNTIKDEGIVITSKVVKSYPEVTGYLIPTLIDAKEFELAKQYADFLVSVQRPNGAFAGPDGREYVFDAGQALRGLVAASQKWDYFKLSAIKTADYIVSCTEDNGKIPAIYNGAPSENIHVFVLPALMQASRVFGIQKYADSAKKSALYYKSVPNILNENTMIHFLAYILDGFIDLGQKEFVYETVKKIFSRQNLNGKINAYPNVNWSCSTGVAQLAIIAYKLGLKGEGDRALEYMCNLQNFSGGFFGSYGLMARYFRSEEISWANKFFIDAVILKKIINKN